MRRLQDRFAAQILRSADQTTKTWAPLVAIVTDNQDPEQLGRIRVRYPSLPGDGADDASRWIPVMSVGAGHRRGWFFLPDVNDEVLVMFEHGEFDRPIVVGSLWNGARRAPMVNVGGNPQRAFISRSRTKIVFDDENGSILIQDGGGKGRILIEGGNVTLVADAGDVSLSAPAGAIAIQADDISISAGGDVRWFAGGSSTMSAGTSATLKGATKLSLASGGGVSSLNSGGGSASPTQVASSEIPDPFGS